MVTAIAMSACNVTDRYLPKLLAGETIAPVSGVVGLAIGPNGAVHYALAGGDVYSLGVRSPELVAHFPTTRLDSIAFSPVGVLHAAYRDVDGVTVAAWQDGAATSVVQVASTDSVDIAFDNDGGLLVGAGDRIVDGQGRVVSGGWHSPKIAPGRGKRLWVADDAPGSAKELVGRGRENDKAKRRRFASALPARTDPSDVAVLKNEVLVCSRNYGTVYRLHIGLDDVARRRAPIEGLRCRTAIVVSVDNSVITATDDAIVRYGAR